jgi:hypothetical protein
MKTALNIINLVSAASSPNASAYGPPQGPRGALPSRAPSGSGWDIQPTGSSEMTARSEEKSKAESDDDFAQPDLPKRRQTQLSTPPID